MGLGHDGVQAMRWFFIAALLLYAAAVTTVRAQSSYALQPGDTIQVWMAQSEDLRREVVIGPDGGVSLPLAGHVRAEGLTLLQLEMALREQLKPLFKQVDLTLMLRPGRDAVIYVVGEVTTPGAFPYRPNMTVLHAVTVAGGIYRAAVLPADQDRSVVVARQVEDGRQRLRELSARITRLQAEISGRTSILEPDDHASDPLLVQEQMLMEARALSVATMDEAQRQSERLNQRNKQALEEQMATVTKRIQLAKERLESVSTLIARGGAESSQRNRHEADIAELEGEISALATEMVASERAATADKARFQAARQDRQTQLLTELQSTQKSYEETSERLNDSKRIMSIYGASAAAAQEREQRSISFSIVRSRDGIPVEIPANETSPLEPGDLIRARYEGDAEVAISSPATGAVLTTASSATPLPQESHQ